ncbi:MAG: hypothetical protein SFU56_04830 [Capsulimonadales bacterium]|nr:hypothetical protein [Capsulimonadales bacterium]
MTNRDSLSEADWELLQRTVEAVTDAVMVAHPGGTLSEVFAVFRGWTEATQMFEGNPFVQELLLVAPDELRERNEASQDEFERSAEDIVNDAADLCRRSVALLNSKNPEDTETFRRVVLFLGEKVARASVEGGFFGIGGKRISDEENQVLERIAAALE